MKFSNNRLKIRLFKSILLGILFFSFLIVSFIKIEDGPEDDEIAVVLRKVLHFDEKIWTKLYSENRLAPKVTQPQKGEAPRFNGDLGLKSAVKLDQYRVRVDSGAKELSLPMSAFQALPKAEYSSLFKCIEGWSNPIDYAGVRFSDFMKAYQVGMKSDGSYYRYVGLETPDKEYYVSIDMDSMLHPQTVLAYEMNEAPLSLKNGAPLRLIITVKYGIKNLKRIGHIFFSDERPADYWAEEGYDWWSGL